jgi:3-hydroxy-9,10-secoandrosta-1,3,5(10)-triene-9,17-dione monooxygenase reductase component
MSLTIEVSDFRAVLGHFATGVVVMTGMHEGSPAGLTCQSFFSLSLNPPLVAIAPGISSTSWPRASSTGRVCINVLGEEQEVLARTFASSGADKFASVGWTRSANGAPRLEAALAWIDCEILDVREWGDHYLVVAGVEALGSGPGQPLLFYRGGFGGFAP